LPEKAVFSLPARGLLRREERPPRNDNYFQDVMRGALWAYSY